MCRLQTATYEYNELAKIADTFLDAIDVNSE